VRGKVALEGRVDMTALVDVVLRQRGRYVDVQDDLFAVANDAATETEGIQIQLAEDGGFELAQIPVGRLDVHLHLDGYLDGWIAGLDLYPGQIVEDRDVVLLGGDVAGYLDVDGQTLPDNEVTLADWDFVAFFFGAAIEEEGAERADITADGAINIRDLSLVGANYRDRGPRPVYKEMAVEAGEVVLGLHGAPEEIAAGQVVALAVRGEGLRGIRAFELELRYAAEDWTMVGWEMARGGLSVQREDAGGWVTAAVLPGRERDFSRAEELVVWQLRALHAEAAVPELHPRIFLDRWEREVPAHLLEKPTADLLPAAFALGQNYPNPFNPETTIPFAVPAVDGTASSAVRVEIFDILGQRVAVLWDGELAAGEYQLQWDGRDGKGRMLGSGVYLYRLQLHQGGVQIKRMLLVR